jgi:hypothetical protein
MHEGSEENHTDRFVHFVDCRAKFIQGTFRLRMRIVGHVGTIARNNHLESWRESIAKREREGICSRTLRMHVAPYDIRLQVLPFKRGEPNEVGGRGMNWTRVTEHILRLSRTKYNPPQSLCSSCKVYVS